MFSYYDSISKWLKVLTIFDLLFKDFEKDSELAQILRDFFRDVKNNEESLPVVKEIVKSMER